MLLIDYVLVSFIGGEVLSISEYLFENKLDEFTILDSTIRGFKFVYTNGFIFVHYDNKGVKPVVLLEIRSKGCRKLEDETNHSWATFFQKITLITQELPIERYGIKRLDIAIDSFSTDTLTPSRAKKYVQQQLISSRFQTQRIIEEFRIQSAVVIGKSVYFGKRASDLSILIYDKQLEASSADCWYRTELRMKNMWGAKAVNTLLEAPETFSAFIVLVLQKNIQFRSVKKTHTEIRRRPLATWYQRYLAYIEQLKLHGL